MSEIRTTLTVGDTWGMLMAVGVGTMVNFGGFSAQMCSNVFMRILFFSPYQNHYRIIVIAVVFSNGILLFNILFMGKEACSVEIATEIVNSSQHNVFTAEPEWGDQNQSLQSWMQNSAGSRFCVTIFFLTSVLSCEHSCQITCSWIFDPLRPKEKIWNLW